MMTFTQTFMTLAFLVAVSNAAPHHEINVKLPEECKGKGFCSIKPEGYDEIQDLIDSLLTPAFIEANAKNIEDRSGPTFEYSPKEDWHNCPYTNQTVWPHFHSEPHDKSDFDFIVQSNKLNQSVQSITCAYDKIPINTTEQCSQDLGLKSFNMQSRCETSKARRILTVLDRKTMQLVSKSYDVDCCCSCHIYRTDETNKID